MRRKTLAVLFATASLLTAGSAIAQVSLVNGKDGRAADLSPATLRQAKPLPLPRASAPATPRAMPAPVRAVSFPGSLPAEEPAAAAPGAILDLPAGDTGDGEGARSGGRSKGTAGYPFSATRVFPDAAVSTSPYRMAGKLLFRDPRTNAWYMCSAAIISPRLVLTAGHCVYNGASRYFFTDWRFIPAYNATVSVQPYGQWTWAAVHVTTPWANGGGRVPNAADFGLLEMNDQVIGGVTRTIGSYLGWYAVATGRLTANHLTALGYPGNIDAGGRMIANSGETRLYTSTTGVMGSSMGGGSSGGPWLEDFGVFGSGQLIANSSYNRIVGVTSFGPAGGPSPIFMQGSSILNNDFLTIRTTACARRTGNC